MNRHTYYLAANTGEGYVSFLDDMLGSFKKVIILKNITEDSKRKLFNEAKKTASENKIMFDTVIRCASCDETDALVLPELSTIITDENLVTKDYPLYSDIIDFTPFCEYDFSVRKNTESIDKKIMHLKKKLYNHLTDAKSIHDEWEKIYISNLDFEGLNNACNELIGEIFSGTSDVSTDKDVKNINRFFGTMLARGTINYIDELTSDLNKRIFIKGRPGTGKSTLLKRIVSFAHNKGFNTETYYCSLDPSSLDMVIIRDLGICIFDSTAPHEKFPIKANDSIFDIYKLAAINDPDTLYANELMHIESRYNSEIKKAKECLYTALALRRSRDFMLDKNEECINNLIQKILSMSCIIK